MDRTRFEKPPRWWSPKLSPLLVRCCRPLRERYRTKTQRIPQVEFRGLEHLQSALAQNAGILIAPNHSSHADAVIMYHTADQAGVPFYFMTSWQVLGLVPPLRSWFLRKHGCFSVDREGTDLKSFKQAVEILQTRPNPLVIFPEGEVYHLNERVTPFREGPATIALSAARRSERPLVCIPCGLRYFYVEDPTAELLELMNWLEESLFWRPRPDLPLPERIYRVGEGILALKELEYLGHTKKGSIPERVKSLSDDILRPLESKYSLGSKEGPTPERVKAVRQKAIERVEQCRESGADAGEFFRDLDDVYLVTQMFSYPGEYVAEKASIERIAETLDKFEEDLLPRRTATIRGVRRAVVSLGEPIDVAKFGKGKSAAQELTKALESRVQELLDGVPTDSTLGK